MNDIQLFRQLVSCNDDQPVTTSRKVAEAFKKLHKNVIRKIESLDCSEDFRQLNFEPVDFIDKNGEARKEYLITKDGMAFLVMGFTGKEAAKFKEAYIAAFNWMAGMLQERHEIDMLMGDFTRRESVSVSDGSFHGRGLAKRKADKASLQEELTSITNRLQMALELIEQ
ncbi:MAG: Rha family transcriptional regulator [Hafnia sp.]